MDFLVKTDINSVRGIAISLLYTEITPTEFSPLIIHHPFFSTGIIPMPAEYGTFRTINIMDDPDALERARLLVKKDLKSRSDLDYFFVRVQRPYRMAFLKYIKRKLSRQDFSRMLGFVWVDSENPSMDLNVSIQQLVKWFHEADPEHLMDTFDRYVYNDLRMRTVIKVYRGVGVGRNPVGLSWTMNKPKAEWFAHRFDHSGMRGYVQSALIHGEDVLAYFNTSGEDEIVADSRKMNITLLED